MHLQTESTKEKIKKSQMEMKGTLWKFLDKTFFCKFCGDVFFEKKSRKSDRVPTYCSRECSSKDKIGFPSASTSKFKKGHSTWNKGLKMPIEFGQKISNNARRRIKISEALTGKHLSEKHRLALRVPKINARGEKHHSWKGGITPINHKLRWSFEMKQWRRAIFERDNYTCQECGKHGVALNAHHIIPFSISKEAGTSLSNGVSLCVPCHSIMDKRNRHIFKAISVIENGFVKGL